MKARTRIVTVIGVALMLVCPALAQASLPKTSKESIVPGQSIGGLGLGGSQASVEKAWGHYPGGDCDQICTYFSPHRGAAEARLETTDSVHFKVFEVLIKTDVELSGRKDVAHCKTPTPMPT